MTPDSKYMKDYLYDDFYKCHQDMLHPLISDLMKEPLFQRLDRVSQLSLKTHTRESLNVTRGAHSRGVRLMASIYVHILNKNTREEERISEIESLTIQTAGLLHDIGHGPFSHLFEHVLAKINIKWNHEAQSVKIVKYLLQKINPSEKYGLPSDFTEAVCDMIIGISKDDHLVKYSDSFFNRYCIFTIINGDHQACLDVDKFDYMRRDSFSVCSQQYYDLVSKSVENIMLNSKIENDKIVYSVRASESLVLFAHLLYVIYRYVHFNPKEVGIEVLFSDIQRNSNIKTDEYLNDLDKFVSFDDESFVKMLRSETNTSSLWKRFDDRQGYEMVGNIDIQDRDGLNMEMLVKKAEEALRILMDDIENEDYVFITKIINRILKRKAGKWNILEVVDFYDDSSCITTVDHQKYLKKYLSITKLPFAPVEYNNEIHEKYDSEELPFHTRTIQLSLYAKTMDRNKIKRLIEAFKDISKKIDEFLDS